MEIRLEEDLINFQSTSDKFSANNMNNTNNINMSQNVSPIKKRQNSGLITQNDIQEDFASISRAYQSNQRQTDDRDLEISPSIEKQSYNEEEEDFGRQKIKLESAGANQEVDRNDNTPFSNLSRKNSKKDKSVTNLRDESSVKKEPFSLDKTSKIKQASEKSLKHDNAEQKIDDFDFDNLAYDESFDNVKSLKDKQHKIQKSSDNKLEEQNKIVKGNELNIITQQKVLDSVQIQQGLSGKNEVEEEYELEEFNESIQENKVNDDNEYFESARGVEISERKINKSADSQQDQHEQKKDYFNKLHKENSVNNAKHFYPTESPQITSREDEFNLKEDNFQTEDIAPTPKKLGASDIDKKGNQEVSPQFSLGRMSVNEEDIFNQSAANQYISLHQQPKELVKKSLRLDLDVIEIYNVIKKKQGTIYQTVTLKSYFDLQTAQIVFNCSEIKTAKQISFQLNLSKLFIGSQIADKTNEELSKLNREEVINEVQEYMYNNLLVYVVEGTEIVVLSESQLSLVKRIQNKFILKHYRNKFQMKIADEFLAASYSCYVQIGTIKRNIFILIITQSLSNHGSDNNECQKKFIKLSNVSIRQIAKNQQIYLYDNIHFDAINKVFYFDYKKFQTLIQQKDQTISIESNHFKQVHSIQDQNGITHSKQPSQQSLHEQQPLDKNIQQSNHSQQNIQQQQQQSSQKNITQIQETDIQHSKQPNQKTLTGLPSQDKNIQQSSQKRLEEQPIIQTINHKDQNINNQQEDIQLVDDYPVSNINGEPRIVKISAYWQQKTNTIILREDKINGYLISSIQSYTYPLDKKMEVIELQVIAKSILSNCSIQKNNIIYFGKSHEEAANKLKNILVKEEIIKSIDISIANSRISGSAYFGRRGPKWFVKLHTNTIKSDPKNNISNFNNDLIKTDQIEITEMTKNKRQKIIKYFDLIINSNIEITADKLKFIDKQQFLEKIDIQILKSPQKQLVIV